MVAWGIFRRKPQAQQKLTTGRFEIERDGEVAYLEYNVSGISLCWSILKFLKNCATWAWLLPWQKPLCSGPVKTSSR